MAKNKYTKRNPGEVYFVSKNENTLPSEETVLEQIRNCIPYKYNKERYKATRNRMYLSRDDIYYNINKVDSNRYRISLFYDTEITTLGYLVVALLFIFLGGIGGNIGGHSGGDTGMIIGFIIGVLIAAGFVAHLENGEEAEQVCDSIVLGIKEYERAHLLNLEK